MGELWRERDVLTPPEAGSPDEFGAAVGLASDTVLVGAPGDASTQGAVFAYDLGGAPSCELPSQKFTGCVGVEHDLLKAIRKDPEQYYVNVHTGEFPEGAVRGQLEDDDSHRDW